MKNHKLSIVLLVAGLLGSGVAFAAHAGEGNGGGSKAGERVEVDGLGYVDGSLTPRSSAKLMAYARSLDSDNVALRVQVKELERVAGLKAAGALGTAGKNECALVLSSDKKLGNEATAPAPLRVKLAAFDKAYPRAKYVAGAAVTALLATEVTGRTHIAAGLASAAKGAYGSATSAFGTLSEGGDRAHIRMSPAAAGASRR